MCGILGFVTKNNTNSKFYKNLIRDLSHILEHRGPDQINFCVSNNQNVYLGHTRLSIQDLSSNGSQPMHINNGRYIISYNGEIYNHYTLRSELDKLHKYNWKSKCDTETLLLCFEKWGVKKTLVKIDGMFSIILYDKYINKIYLIRDRYGEKPLYFGNVNEYLVFSSEIKVFKSFPNFNNSLSIKSITNYLKYNFIPAPLTIFKNIFKINQGSYIEFDLNEKININPDLQKKWFDPLDLIDLDYQKELSTMNEAALINTCEKLINESVNSRLISDVPIGVFLSGGVDSSIIAYFANKNSDKTLKTYSVIFDEKNYNEGIISKKTSQYLNSNHQEFKFDSNVFFDVIKKLTDIYDEPFSDISQLPTSYLSYMVSKNVKVALSGDGGDEFFGGYEKYLWDKSIWKKLSWIKFEKRVVLGNFLKKNIIENNLMNKLFNKKFITNLTQISKRLISVQNNYDLYDSLISNLFYENPLNSNFKAVENIYEQIDNSKLNNLDQFEKMMFYDILFTFSNGILCKLDRAAMHYSLETRLPFLNINLNKFSLNLPANYKINNFETKYILKKILYKSYKSNHFSKIKTGFGIPISKWLRNEIKDWSREIIFTGDKNKIFNNEYYRDAWKYHQQGYDNSSILWNNIVYNLWSYSQ